MSYKVIQEHAAPVECCLQNKHINLTSSKSVLIDDTLSWHELHVQGECPKKLDIQELSSLHINQKTWPISVFTHLFDEVGEADLTYVLLMP